jgi:hypothetical protein
LRTLVVALLSIVTALPLAAQPVSAGARVRVSATDFVAPVVGSVQSIRSDTLVILEDGDAAHVWSIPRAQVTRFETSQGYTARDYDAITKGALWGALIGGGTAAITTSILRANQGKTTNYRVGATTAIGIVAGGALGAIYKSKRRVEGWASGPVPNRVAVLPDRRGASLAVGWDF